jgi:hypothetical protein
MEHLNRLPRVRPNLEEEVPATEKGRPSQHARSAPLVLESTKSVAAGKATYLGNEATSGPVPPLP